MIDVSAIVASPAIFRWLYHHRIAFLRNEHACGFIIWLNASLF